MGVISDGKQCVIQGNDRKCRCALWSSQCGAKGGENRCRRVAGGAINALTVGAPLEVRTARFVHWQSETDPSLRLRFAPREVLLQQSRLGLSRCQQSAYVWRGLVLGLEHHGGRVQAVALTRRRRAVGEDVALVAIAAGAADLYTDHAVAAVAQFTNVLWIEGFVKAGPAGAGLKLGTGCEQRQVAQFAVIVAVILVIQQAAAERGFGTLVEQDAAFFFGQRLCAGLFLFFAQGRQVEAAGGQCLGHQALP